MQGTCSPAKLAARRVPADQMVKISKNPNLEISPSETISWGKVIADAEEQLGEAKRRQLQLRASIRLFRKKMEAGEPLPDGLESATQN